MVIKLPIGNFELGIGDLFYPIPYLESPITNPFIANTQIKLTNWSYYHQMVISTFNALIQQHEQEKKKEKAKEKERIKYKSMIKDKSKSRCLPIMTGTRRNREERRRGRWYLTSVPSIFDRCRPHTKSKVRLGQYQTGSTDSRLVK